MHPSPRPATTPAAELYTGAINARRKIRRRRVAVSDYESSVGRRVRRRRFGLSRQASPGSPRRYFTVWTEISSRLLATTVIVGCTGTVVTQAYGPGHARNGGCRERLSGMLRMRNGREIFAQ